MTLKDRPSLRSGDKALAAAALCVLALLPALSNGFVDWDDLDNFVRGPFPREGLRWVLTTFYSGHYQPLTWLSLLPFPLTPLSIHAGNLLLHGASVALLALCLRRWWLGALLWGLHPLRVEAVVWASERREVLATALILAACLAYLRDRRRLSLGLYGLSLLAKPTGALMFGLLFALDLTRDRKPKAKELAPFAALGLGSVLVALAAQRQYGSTTGIWDYGLFERLGVASYNAAFYLAKTFFPARLSPIYPLPEPLSSIAAPMAASAVLLLAAAWAIRKSKPALAAGLWYACALLPTAGLVRGGPQLAADRFGHLATIAPCALAGALLPAPASAAISIVFGVMTWRQTSEWKDTETLWRGAVAADPGNWIAHNKLGFDLQRQGRAAEALEQYKLAVAANPSFAVARNNLGNALVRLGLTEEGITQLQEAVRLAPAEPAARANLEAALNAARFKARR